MRITFTFISLLIFFFSNAQDGTLDNTFGAGGFNTYHPTNPVNVALNPDGQKIAVLANGTILQAFSVSNGTNSDFSIVRYLSNGSPDPAFGVNGDGMGAIVDLGGDDYATTMAVQTDGKIIVGGFSNVAGNGIFALVRYNANGTLDNTFNAAGTHPGTVTTTIGNDDDLFSLAIQNDGKIIAAGHTKSSTDYDFAMVRYNSNGTRDNTFGVSGIVRTQVNAGVDDFARAVGLYYAGKIVVAGTSTVGGKTVFAVVRYNADGSKDNTFGTGGVAAQAPTGSGGDAALALNIQTDGRIIAAGLANDGSTNDFAIVRYTATGALDNTFNGTGKVTTDINHSDDIAYSVAVQKDGKIVISGKTDVNTIANGNFASDYDFAVARYTSTGALDISSFNPNAANYKGIAVIDIGSANDIAFSLASQGNNIIVGGIIADNALAVARIINSSAFLLPVTLYSFDASREGNSVILNWQTVTEINSSSFEVQKSNDGKNFSTIGVVAAGGNSNSLKTYSFNDIKPFASVNYYRLKMIDIDRKETYSKVIAIRFNSANISLETFPDPVINTVNIQVKAPAGLVRVQLVDVLGRVVKTAELNSNGGILAASIDMATLKSGMYFIKVNDQVAKVIKQ